MGKNSRKIKEFGGATKGAQEVAARRKANEAEAKRAAPVAKVEAPIVEAPIVEALIEEEPVEVFNPKLASKELRQHVREVVILLDELGAHSRFMKNSQLMEGHGLIVAQRTIQGCAAKLKVIDEYIG